jgi:hypothetical protein
MMRQHYVLRNQDCIVRLELRLRYYILTQQRFEQLESKLSFSQLAALCSASDEEFIQLADRALRIFQTMSLNSPSKAGYGMRCGCDKYF